MIDNPFVRAAAIGAGIVTGACVVVAIVGAIFGVVGYVISSLAIVGAGGGVGIYGLMNY
jgi:hypothetical protein